MKKVVDVDMEIRCAGIKTALNRFFKKHPELDYWRDEFEYMSEHGKDFCCNDVLVDGSRNYDWTFALHLDAGDGYYYIAVIERA